MKIVLYKKLSSVFDLNISFKILKSQTTKLIPKIPIPVIISKTILWAEVEPPFNPKIIFLESVEIFSKLPTPTPKGLLINPNKLCRLKKHGLQIE